MATFIPADKTIPTREVQPQNPRDGFSLQEIQGFVGGYFEIRHLSDGRMMVLNEEGKINNLPRNERATALAEFPTKSQLQKTNKELAKRGWNVMSFVDPSIGPDTPVDYIAGDVLICSRKEMR